MTPSQEDWKRAALAWGRLDWEQQAKARAWLLGPQKLVRSARLSMPYSYLERGVFNREHRKTQANAEDEEAAGYVEAVTAGFAGTMEEWRKQG